MVKWLGFDWNYGEEHNGYFASDYFGYMYQFAEALIQAGLAYVDEQNADQMRAMRGTLTEKGTNSPWRDRPAQASLTLLREMRDGKHPDGSMALRSEEHTSELQSLTRRSYAVFCLKKKRQEHTIETEEKRKSNHPHSSN